MEASMATFDEKEEKWIWTDSSTEVVFNVIFFDSARSIVANQFGESCDSHDIKMGYGFR